MIVKTYYCPVCKKQIDVMRAKSGKIDKCPHCGVLLRGLNEARVSELTQFLVGLIILTVVFAAASVFFPPALFFVIISGTVAYILYRKRKAALGVAARAPAAKDRAAGLWTAGRLGEQARSQPPRLGPRPRHRVMPGARVAAHPGLSQARFCIACGTPTVLGAKFCVKCGRETGAISAAQKSVPAAAKPVTKLGPASAYPAAPFQEFAQRATQSSTSITIKISDFARLVDAVKDALIGAYPNLDPGESFSHASGGFSLRCPACGPLRDEVVSVLYLAGTGMMQGAIFGGPNVANLSQGCCPGCQGNMIVAAFSPQKIKAQLEAARAEAASAEGIPQLIATCPGVPFLGSLAVSPDEGLVCCAAPNGVVAYESGTDRLRWSLAVPSTEACLCRFVGPERCLVLSKKQTDQTLIQLVSAADGSVVAEALGPKAYYSDCDTDPHTGLFVGQSSYDTLLTISTAGDKIEFLTWKCGQIYSPGPKIGPDGKCYVIVHYHLYRMDGKQKTPIIAGGQCMYFGASNKIYCGGGYADRSGESALHIADLDSGTASEIPWGKEPIDEIAPAGGGRLLIANIISEVHVGRFPNAVVTMLSAANRKKEWSLTIGDLKPWRSAILVTAPEEGWALIQTGKLLKLIAIQDGKTIRVLPKQSQEFVTAKWLVSKKLLYVARNPDRKAAGMLECYSI